MNKIDNNKNKTKKFKSKIIIILQQKINKSNITRIFKIQKWHKIILAKIL